jgi:hypothetical protein
LRDYTASLTTPPCTEDVRFLIAEQPLPLDVNTFNSLKSVIKFNSRFTQNSLGKPNLLSMNGNANLMSVKPAFVISLEAQPGSNLVVNSRSEPVEGVAKEVERRKSAMERRRRDV